MGDFRVSASARIRLAALVAELAPMRAVASLVWAVDPGTKVGNWMVGFYDKECVEREMIVEADGMDIVVEPQWRDALTGAVLDYSGDIFSVKREGT